MVVSLPVVSPSLDVISCGVELTSSKVLAVMPVRKPITGCEVLDLVRAQLCPEATTEEVCDFLRELTAAGLVSHICCVYMRL